MKYFQKLALFLILSMLLTNCEKEELVLTESNQKDFKVYAYDVNDIPQINSKIKQRSRQAVLTKSGKSDADAYWIDEVNIFAAIDNNGNEYYSYRLYFNRMPKNTFYNIIISEKEENETIPFVIEFEEENGVKTSIRFYELEYFLNALIERDEKLKNSNMSLLSIKNDETNGPLDFTDCDHLINGNTGGTDSSSDQNSGGTGTANDNDGPFVSDNGSTYTPNGSSDVENDPGGQSGGARRVGIETGDAEIVGIALRGAGKSDDDDRVICPDGELIIVENNVEVIIIDLNDNNTCIFESLEDLNLFKSTIGLFEDDPTYDLIFKQGTLSDCGNRAGVIACTDAGSLQENGRITIYVVDNAVDDIEMAGYLLHEGIHAEIYRYVDLYHDGDVDPNDRARLWQLYAHYGAQNGKDVGTSEAQHRYMTEKYVDPLASALRELDGNRFDLSYYKPFAWDGLKQYGLSGYYENGNLVYLDDSEFSEKRQQVINTTTFGDDCN